MPRIDGPSQPTARLEWNLHLAIEVVIPTHRTFAGNASVDDGLHGNSLLAYFISRACHCSTKLDQCRHLCRALFQSFAFVLQRSWRQCIPDLARRLVGATAGDVNGHMRSAEGTAEVGNVPPYFPKVEALLTIRQILLHRPRVDVVKRDPLENIFGRIPKHDNDGASRLVDNFPGATQKPARRQRNDTIATVLPECVSRLETPRGGNRATSGDCFEDARLTSRKNVQFPHPSRKTDIQGGPPVVHRWWSFRHS
jgi:hypothetical protein